MIFTVSRLRIAILLLSVTVSVHSFAQEKVVGYYPTWMQYSLPPGQVKFNYLTHLMHAFAWPLADGSITTDQSPVDTAIINATHRAGRKILISLGGATESGAFSGLAADSVLRAAFASNILAYVLKYNYDGVDLDWESPGTVGDKTNEVALVKKIREVFTTVNTPLLLTMAIGVTSWTGQWRDYPHLLPYVDWFHAMTYDFHGSWTAHSGHNAPMYAPMTDYDGCVTQGIVYLHTSRGIPSSQLVLGLPFYGKEFVSSTLYGPSTGCTDLLYSDVVTRESQNYSYHWDNLSQVPYLVGPSNNGIVTFDDSTSLSIKCAYAKRQNLAGVMIWALGQDLVAGKQPLMEAVGIAMSSSTGIEGAGGDAIPSATALLANYPNPFNPTTVISYQLSVATEVKIVIYDLLGQEIAVLVNEKRGPGSYTIEFNAGGLASGVYLCRLLTNSSVQTRELVLVR
ncbi:MAG: glycosyl hydrolase family 18 protein [Bacteroidota bacterium]